MGNNYRYHFSVQQKIFNLGRNQYSRSEVVAMEWLVQEVLKFQCFLPTVYNFLWYLVFSFSLKYLKIQKKIMYIKRDIHQTRKVLLQ